MGRRVRGEQTLPLATEQLPRATGDSTSRRLPRAAAYLAVSVQVADDGSWRVHVIKLDRASGHVVTERLDGGPHGDGVASNMAPVLAYWADELASGHPGRQGLR